MVRKHGVDDIWAETGGTTASFTCLSFSCISTCSEPNRARKRSAALFPLLVSQNHPASTGRIKKQARRLRHNPISKSDGESI